MARDFIEPTVADDGTESHPAFAKVMASRVTSSPGAILFDSEVRHQHYVVLRISGATRRRRLNSDSIFEDRQMIEVGMSEAQWAQLVSSLNSGGTPATLLWTQADGDIPGLPYAPRMEKSIAEVREAAARQYEKVQAALAAVEAKPTKANIRDLRLAMENAASDVTFAATSLNEHVENTVTRAKADIEAAVAQAAARRGLAPEEIGDYSFTPRAIES